MDGAEVFPGEGCIKIRAMLIEFHLINAGSHS
jgi:hypothetical protein